MADPIDDFHRLLERADQKGVDDLLKLLEWMGEAHSDWCDPFSTYPTCVALWEGERMQVLALVERERPNFTPDQLSSIRSLADRWRGQKFWDDLSALLSKDPSAAA